MKRIVLLLSFVMFCVVSMFAKADVTLQSGSLSKLKASKAKVYVVWDYTHATLEGKNVKEFLKEKGADWERDYKAELQRAEKNFMDRFNDKTKSVTVTDKKSEAEYTIVIEVKDFHYGSTGVSVMIGFGAGDAHMNALMNFYEKGVKESFAVIDVDGVAGAGYGNEKRRVETYREVAEQVVKLIKKAK